jgi:hypothetical protein
LSPPPGSPDFESPIRVSVVKSADPGSTQRGCRVATDKGSLPFSARAFRVGALAAPPHTARGREWAGAGGGRWCEMGSGSFLKVLLSNIDVLAGYGLLSLSLSLSLSSRPIVCSSRPIRGGCSVVSRWLLVLFNDDSVRAPGCDA